MTDYRIYVSERGFPLLYIHQPNDVPTLTLENYTKWYEGIYLVHPNGNVTKVESSDVTAVTDGHDDARWVDHLYHPRLLYRLAKHLGAVVCERSHEVAIGRWMLESGNCDDLVEVLAFDDPYFNDES